MGARASTQHLAVTVALVFALCLLVLPVTTGNAQALPADQVFVPDQVIVKLAPGAEIQKINSEYGTRVEGRFLDNPNTRIYLLETERHLDVPGLVAFAERLLDDRRIDDLAEPNFFVEAPEGSARHRAFPADGAKPSPEHYSNPEFAYPDSALNLASAHGSYKGEGATVAVLDTGAQLGHPALKANFKGVARHDFVDGDKDPSEPPFARDKQRRKNEMVGHGTHVAGIVDLVAPKAKIMPLRVLSRRGYGTVFNIAEAITFADSKGADVINLSLGTPDPTLLGLGLNPPELLRDKVNEAISGGAVVVAATGNSNSPVKNYPAAQEGLFAANEGLLAVTAVDFEEEKSSFANYGTWVDISAPGEHILSTYPVSRYAYWSGTSMATPFVAGQAALIHQADGAPDPADVEEKIRRSARFVEFYEKNPNYVLCQLGAGHTDIGASLGQLGPGPNLCPTF